MASETPASVPPVVNGASKPSDSEQETSDSQNDSHEQSLTDRQEELDSVSILDEVKEQISLLDPIFECEIEIRDLSAQRAELRRQLEQIEADLETAKDAKENMLGKLPAALLSIRGISDSELPPDQEDSNGDNKPNAGSGASGSSKEPVTWTERSTKSICDGVPRLGDKKLEKLVEKYPTLGDLKQAHVRADSAKKHFSSELPSGIGKTTADELLNRLLAAETGTPDQSAEEQAQETRQEQASDNKPKPTEQQETATPKNAQKKVPTEKETPPKRDHVKWCDATVASLREQVSHNLDGCLDAQVDIDTWNEGSFAFSDGQPYASCPEGYTDDYATDWLRGWLGEELLQNTSTNEPDEVDEKPESEAPSEPASAVDRDSLDEIAARIKESGNTKHQAYEDDWNAGYEAGIDELPLESCPQVSLDRTEDWIRGWIEGQKLSESL